MNAETPLSPAFVRWFRQHGPKGVNNSINALCLLLLLRDVKEPLSTEAITQGLGLPRGSTEHLLLAFKEEGFIAVEPVPGTHPRRPWLKGYKLIKPLEAPALS